MYDNDLMMAVFVGSTAFAGFTAVVIGQLTQSRLPAVRKRKIKNWLVGSFGLCLIVLLSAVAWFVSPSLLWKSVGVFLLIVQVNLCGAAAWGFWSASTK